jgi:hypothetical protein
MISGVRYFALVAAASTLSLGAGAADAAGPDEEAIRVIVDKLVAEGFEGQIRIRSTRDGVRVKATGTGGVTERIFSRDGSVVLEEETRHSDGRRIEREFSESGQLLEEEIRSSDGRIEREFDRFGNLVEEKIETSDGKRIEREFDAGKLVEEEFRAADDEDRKDEKRDDDRDGGRGKDRDRDRDRGADDKGRYDDDMHDDDSDRAEGD